MNTHCHSPMPRAQHGITMIEVLITIVIVAFGLLGVAGLQARMQLAEIEAYQRAQAIVLLQDIVNRINANRKNSMAYAGAAVGTGNAVQNCTGLTGADLDLCQWNNALLGATETSGGGQSVGTMIGARGCITNTVATMPREFVVAVVWQGLNPTQAPASTTCGQNEYGNEAMRRAMVASIKIGCLQNDAAGVCVTP